MSARASGRRRPAAYDAPMMTQSRAHGAYFYEAARAGCGQAQAGANWVMGELASG
jgi:aspartyl-tRNA(Asn)/glutamyl-tRNA(Gln) amidotransferase subunit B